MRFERQAAVVVLVEIEIHRAEGDSGAERPAAPGQHDRTFGTGRQPERFPEFLDHLQGHGVQGFGVIQPNDEDSVDRFGGD